MLRLIREEFTKEYRGVVIDDRALYEEVRGYVEAIAPELADRVEFYDAEDEGLPIFERFHISRAAASRRSTARCGCRRAARSSSSAPRRSR